MKAIITVGEFHGENRQYVLQKDKRNKRKRLRELVRTSDFYQIDLQGLNIRA